MIGGLLEEAQASYAHGKGWWAAMLCEDARRVGKVH
jgi:hypothetical protein